jgi:molecular chaperone DnaK
VQEQGGTQKILIQAGTELPVERWFNFSTAEDGQDSIIIDLASGRLEDFHPIVRYTIKDISPAPKGETSIRVLFTMDENNHLSAEASDANTEQPLLFAQQRWLYESQTVQSV